MGFVNFGKVSLVFCLFPALLSVRVTGNDGQVIGGVHAYCCALRVSPCADPRGSTVSGEGWCNCKRTKTRALVYLCRIHDVVDDLCLYL